MICHFVHQNRLHHLLGGWFFTTPKRLWVPPTLELSLLAGGPVFFALSPLISIANLKSHYFSLSVLTKLTAKPNGCCACLPTSMPDQRLRCLFQLMWLIWKFNSLWIISTIPFLWGLKLAWVSANDLHYCVPFWTGDSNKCMLKITMTSPVPTTLVDLGAQFIINHR